MNFSFEDAAFYALLVIIFLTAIPFGTIDQWFRALFVFTVCLLAAVRIIHGFLKNETFFPEAALLFPLAGILVLAVVQIIPLPFAGNETISADPYYTEDFIILFAGFLAVFEMLLFYTTTRKRLLSLVILVLAVAVGSALFGILREFLLDSEQNILSSYIKPGVGFAQFINRNHYVFLMEMSLGLMLGILLKGKLAEGLRFGGWVLTGILIFASISVNSRGGILSLAGMSVLAVFLHFLTKNKTSSFDESIEPDQMKKTWLIKLAKATSAVFIAFGIVVFMVAFVGGDAVASRMETVQDEVKSADDNSFQRADIWKSTWELIKEKPVAGVGFGAYGVAITRFDDTGGKVSLQQAHNDYLEILASGGGLALILVIIFASLVLKKTLVQFNSRDKFRRSVCFGAALGIIGVLLHSAVDFGLHIGINALVFMILIVIATVRIQTPKKRHSRRKRRGEEFTENPFPDYSET